MGGIVNVSFLDESENLNREQQDLDSRLKYTRLTKGRRMLER